MMQVRIYRPAKTAMQSGRGNTRRWVLEYEPAAPKVVENLMGWVGSRDTMQQVRLRFDTKEEAVSFARREGLAYRIQDEAPQRPARPKNYAAKFLAPAP